MIRNSTQWGKAVVQYSDRYHEHFPQHSSVTSWHAQLPRRTSGLECLPGAIRYKHLLHFFKVLLYELFHACFTCTAAICVDTGSTNTNQRQKMLAVSALQWNAHMWNYLRHTCRIRPLSAENRTLHRNLRAVKEHPCIETSWNRRRVTAHDCTGNFNNAISAHIEAHTSFASE